MQGHLLVEDIFDEQTDIIPIKLGKRIKDLEEPLTQVLNKRQKFDESQPQANHPMSSEDSRSKVVEDQIVDMAYKVLKKAKVEGAL